MGDCFSMKKHIKGIIYANKVFIALQLLLSAIELYMFFRKGEIQFFIPLLVHSVLYLVYGIVTESIWEYKFVRKEYESVCKESKEFYISLMRKIYRTAKGNGDLLTQVLLKQKLTKDMIFLCNVLVLIIIKFI